MSFVHVKFGISLHCFDAIMHEPSDRPLVHTCMQTFKFLPFAFSFTCRFELTFLSEIRMGKFSFKYLNLSKALLTWIVFFSLYPTSRNCAVYFMRHNIFAPICVSYPVLHGLVSYGLTLQKLPQITTSNLGRVDINLSASQMFKCFCL